MRGKWRICYERIACGAERCAPWNGTIHDYNYNLRTIDSQRLDGTGGFQFDHVQPNAYTLVAIAYAEESPEGLQHSVSDTTVINVKNGKDLEIDLTLK